MTFLPIVERELRVAARKPGTYRSRAIMALAAIGVATWMMLMTRYRPPAQMGHSIFESLCVFAFIYCLLESLRVTVDVISEERREGALGLLFLTDLKGYDVVSGKLMATSLNAIYGLLAVFPILAVPLLLGGVSSSEFLRVVLALLNVLFFSLTAGLFISSVSVRARKAMFAGFVLAVLFTLGLAWLGHEVRQATRSAKLEALAGLPSPLFTMDTVFDSSISPWFWWSLGVVHLEGWCFLILACWRVPRVWRDKAETAKAIRWRERLQCWSVGNAEQRKAYRSRLLAINPLYWLDDRYRLQKTAVWGVLLLFVVFWVWQFNRSPTEWLNDGVIVMTGLVLNNGLLIWLAVQAGHRFAEDRQSGALQLLLTTPFSVKEIVRGRWLAVTRQFGWAIMAVLIFESLLMWALLNLMNWRYPWWRTNYPVFCVMMCLVGMTRLVMDAYAICWLGLWLGLTSKNSLRAAFATLWRILLLPWALFLVFAAVYFRFSLLRPGFLGPGWWSETFILLVWFALGLGVDLIFLEWARRRLNRDFRVVAAESMERGRALRRRWPFRRAG